MVAEHLHDARLEGLHRIGVDEVSYRKGHRYLTVVADHDREGAVVWASEGRDAATLSRFFEELGDRTARLRVTSTDIGAGNLKAIGDAREERGLTAAVCMDPFHVDQAGQRGNRPGEAAGLERGPPVQGGRVFLKHTRWALLKDPRRLTTS